MPVPATINDLSTTPGSNSPAGSESPSLIDDYLRTQASFIAQLRDNSAQQLTEFTTAGTAPSFTLTPSPVIASYVAGQRFRVKFHANGAGSDSLNVSALGAKNLKQYDASGNKVAPLVLSQIADVEYDGTDMVILDPLPTRQQQSIDATVATNALTLTLNPTVLDFRSATLTVGAPNTRVVPAPITLVVPNGATLGTTSAVAAFLFLLAIDNAGTVELAVVNQSGNLSLDETGLITTTAIGAGSSSASTIYSTTARSNVPYRVVGIINITEASAGAWATNPTLKQGWGGEASVLAKPQTTLIVAQQSLSGTSIDFNIPSWANRIVLSLNAVSTNGSSTVQVQLGTAASIETSAYSGGVDTIPSGGGAPASFGSGLAIERAGASAATLNRYGLVTLIKVSALDWVGSSNTFFAGAIIATGSSATAKTLAGVLTRVRVTTVNGTDTFDGGQIGCVVD